MTNETASKRKVKVVCNYCNYPQNKVIDDRTYRCISCDGYRDQQSFSLWRVRQWD